MKIRGRNHKRAVDILNKKIINGVERKYTKGYILSALKGYPYFTAMVYNSIIDEWELHRHIYIYHNSLYTRKNKIGT